MSLFKSWMTSFLLFQAIAVMFGSTRNTLNIYVEKYMYVIYIDFIL